MVNLGNDWDEVLKGESSRDFDRHTELHPSPE